MKRSLPLLIIAAVLVAAVALTWVLLRSSRPDQSSTNSSGSEAPGAEPPHIRGNPKARVTLEEFGDFECPVCGTYSVEVKKIEAEFGDRLRVIFREYPLYPTPHKHALIAAQAAEAAGLQDRFWEMHDKLYENQKDSIPIALGAISMARLWPRVLLRMAFGVMRAALPAHPHSLSTAKKPKAIRGSPRDCAR